jgi:hypothetical protein
LFERIAHPFDRSAPDAGGVGHLIQGQPFGRPGQHSGEMKECLSFLVPHWHPPP